MSDFSRRAFLKLMGQGTAALGVGLSMGGTLADTGTAQAAPKRPTGKYQTFQPGVYLDWEKEMIEERMAQAKNPKRSTAGGPPGGQAAITEESILAYNRTWNPYNPLFNDREYARKAGFPSVPAFPNYQAPRGNAPSPDPHGFRGQVVLCQRWE